MVLLACTKIADSMGGYSILYYIILYSSVSVCELVVRIFSLALSASYIVTPASPMSL